MDDVFHPQSEFNNLDWSKLKKDEHDNNYYFSKGDYLYIYGKGHFINVIDEDDNLEIWQLPDILNDYLDWKESNGKNEIRTEINNILKIR